MCWFEEAYLQLQVLGKNKRGREEKRDIQNPIFLKRILR